MKPLALILALAGPIAVAQAPASHGALVWWGDLSAGLEASPLFAGAGLHVSAGRRVAVRVGFDNSEEFTLGARPTSVRAVSVSVGARARQGRLHVAAHAGPSVVWGLGRVQTERPGRGRDPYVTGGAALNALAFVDVGAGVGLGVDVSGNVNPEVSTVGARLALHLRLSPAR